MREILLKSSRHLVDDFDNDGEKEEVRIQFQHVTYLKNNEIVWEHICRGVPLAVKALDINKDGKKEIIVGGSERTIFAFSSKDGRVLKTVQYWPVGDKRAGWVWDIAVDNTLNKGAPGILVGGMAAWGSNGIDVKLYSSDFEEIWKHHIDRSALRLQITTMEENNKNEKSIIITTMDGTVKILDHTGKISRTRKLNAGISALEVVDIDKDRIKEIILGTVDGDLIVLNKDLKDVFRTKISSHYPTPLYNVVARDFDNDSSVEILTVGRRCVGVFNAEGKILHKEDNNIMSGDINGDGTEEQIKLTIEKIIAHQGSTILWEFPTDERIVSVVLADIDDDSKKELIVGLYEGTILILKGNGKIKTSWNVGMPISAIQVGDYNNDGIDEILIGSHFGEVKAYTFEGKQLSSFKMSGEVGSIFVFDIDKDSKEELIVSTTNQAGEIKIFDDSTR